MKASVVQLRYNMKEVLRALERNEPVQVMYRGAVKGIILPATQKPIMRVEDHPFFNMNPQGKPVEEIMDDLRGERYRDI